MTTLVELRGLAVAAGRTPIIASANLLLSRGECLGISGANGSGKTTLLRTIATLRAPAAGQGVVLGAALGSPAVRAVRHRIGLLGHQPALVPSLSLADNLAFHAELRGRPPQVLTAALVAVGLELAAHRRAADCSVGMLRRADLARLALTQSELLLLDEPTDGLDEEARPLVAAAIKSCLERNGGVIVVSHDEGNLAGITTRIHHLAGGNLL